MPRQWWWVECWGPGIIVFNFVHRNFSVILYSQKYIPSCFQKLFLFIPFIQLSIGFSAFPPIYPHHFDFREKEREWEREGEKYQLVASCSTLTKPATEASAESNRESNPQPFDLWEDTPTNWGKLARTSVYLILFLKFSTITILLLKKKVLTFF